MNSIFATEEEFEFSDDDLLDLDLLTKPSHQPNQTGNDLEKNCFEWRHKETVIKSSSHEIDVGTKNSPSKSRIENCVIPRLKQLSNGENIWSIRKDNNAKSVATNLTDFNAANDSCSQDPSQYRSEVLSSRCHESQQRGKEKLISSFKNEDEIQIPSDDDLDIDEHCDEIVSFQRIEPKTNMCDENSPSSIVDNNTAYNCRTTSKRTFPENCSPQYRYCFKGNSLVSQENSESERAQGYGKLSGKSRQVSSVSSISNRNVAKYPVFNNDCLDVTKRSGVPSSSDLKFKEYRPASPLLLESDVQSLEQKRVDRQDCFSRAEQDVTPLKKRKFPGPAGLLPKLNTPGALDKAETPKNNSLKKRIMTPKGISSPAMPTGKDDGDFKKEFWLDLQKQAISKFKGLVYHTISMILKKFLVETCSASLENRLKHARNSVWSKAFSDEWWWQRSGLGTFPEGNNKKAYLNQLDKGKVPLMCALIKAFTLNGSDASIILKDPTGEIQGTIHKRVLDHYQSGLCPGSGLILKQVSIFSPSSRKHYVNITPSNIMLLLPAESSISSSCQASQSSQDQTKLLETNKEDPQLSTANNEEEQNSATEAKELDNIFAADDDFDTWINDSEFLQEMTPELCS